MSKTKLNEHTETTFESETNRNDVKENIFCTVGIKISKVDDVLSTIFQTQKNKQFEEKISNNADTKI